MLEEPEDKAFIRQIALEKAVGFEPAEYILPGIFQVHILVINEIVKPDYRMPLLQKPDGKVHPDKTGGICDKGFQR